MIIYTEEQFKYDAAKLARNIQESCPGRFDNIYAVPRGGIPLGIALSTHLDIPLIPQNEISQRTLVVDDIVDSGKTRKRFSGNYFVCLHSKENPTASPDLCVHLVGDWVHYWWEGEDSFHSAEDIVVRQLQFIGEDVNREGLIDTPKRVIKAWSELFKGYNMQNQELSTSFTEEKYEGIVLLKDIEMYSMCEHHLLPFFGKAHVAYIPNKKIIGVSKLARIVEMFSRRAQIQERIGEQVTKYIMEAIQPKAAACIIEAQHLCMLMRGVQKQNSVMVTSSLQGVFLKDLKAREELMRLIK